MRVSKRREVRLEELDVGDAIEVHWLDASEARRPLSLPEREFDTPVRSIGIYGGLRGLRTKHLILIKEVFVPEEPEYHYNAIPVGMIDRIFLMAKGWWKKREVKKAMRLLDNGTAAAYAILHGAALQDLRAKHKKYARLVSDFFVLELREWELDGLLALRDFWLKKVRQREL